MKRSRKSKRTFFDPDSILTELSQALERDLQSLKHEYVGTDSANVQAFERQVRDFDKKYLPTSHDKGTLEKLEFQKFLDTNSSMLDTNLKLLLKLPRVKRIQSSLPDMEKIHLRARALVHFVLGDVCEDEWFQNCKNSSGASIGVPFVDTSMEQKFTFPMTSTVGAERYWRRYLQFDFQLDCSLKKFNEGVSQDIEPVIGSRATTVDKTKDKRRMICIEPTVNMFLQQGLMHVMYTRLSKVGLDVERLQDQHKELARESSITCRNATIDFSSASDCVSIELLRWLLPPTWFDYLWALRSHHTFLDGRWVELQMMSTMGNATTFPLETLVFWAYGHATRLTEQRTNTLFPDWEDLSVISVFGDDCIVPSDLAEQFCSTCSEIGFNVNFEKSYIGPIKFRESCGGDFAAGRSNRPYYCKAPVNCRLSSLEPWLYIIGNSLIKKYIQYFGSLTYLYDRALWRTYFDIFTRYGLLVKYIPPDFPDDSGLKWFFDRERLELSYRFLSEPIYQDRHGTRFFKFCRFVYRKRRRGDDELRYWDTLKFPKSGDLRRFMTFPRREVGGYVVAKALSAHWAD